MILWFFLSLFLVSIVLLGWLLWPFLSIIVSAAVVTGVFQPVYVILRRWLRPAYASGITCVLIFFILFVPIVLFVGILSNEAFNLYEQAKGAALKDQISQLIAGSRLIDRTNDWLAPFHVRLSTDAINSSLSELGRIVGLFLYQQASSIATNVLAFLVNFFFMLLIAFYLLIDADRLLGFIVDLTPLPDEHDRQLILKFKDMAGAILIGNGLAGLIQGGIGGVALALFGFQSPILWGVIMALVAFLPIVGIGLVFVPAALYLFLKGQIVAGIMLLTIYALLSGLIEYGFKPKLVGKRVQMHSLLVFLAIMGGLKLFGILGIVYGPLVMTAFLTLTDIYRENYQNMVDPREIRQSGRS
jgi:predicted PurR-regulated permease PerM